MALLSYELENEIVEHLRDVDLVEFCGEAVETGVVPQGVRTTLEFLDPRVSRGLKTRCLLLQSCEQVEAKPKCLTGGSRY